MADVYVWVTTLMKGEAERIVGALGCAGYTVGPLSKSGEIEYASSNSISPVVSFQLTEFKETKLKKDETREGVICNKIRNILDEKGVKYHSIVVAMANTGCSWNVGNLKPIASRERDVPCKKKAMKKYDDLTVEQQRKVDDVIIVDILEQIGRGDRQLPTESMQDQFKELGGSSPLGGFCGCTGCMVDLKEKLKKRQELFEHVLGSMDSVRKRVQVPDSDDFIVDLEGT